MATGIKGERFVPDRVALPLLVTGGLLTVAAFVPVVTLSGMLIGAFPRQEGLNPAGAVLSVVFLLATGLPALLTFFFRRRPYARRLGTIAGAALLIYALFFPPALIAGAPFFIPLFFYLIGATGIWALLRSRL